MKKKIYSISLIIIVIDVISKIFISSNNINQIIIPNFFSISFVKNTGAAFSLLEGYKFLFIILAIVAVIYICKTYINEKLNKLQQISIILLISGIVGNLIDRIIYGYVIDFLSFKFGSYFFPVFNIADMCITIGAGLLIIDLIRGETNDNKSR